MTNVNTELTTFTLNDGAQLIIRTYNGERVVTFEAIDKLHQKAIGTTRKNFSRNKNLLVKGIDYYHFVGQSGKEALQAANCRILSELNVNPGNRHFSLYLLTESGYLLLVKSFKDKLSWDIQRQLINGYFKNKTIATIYDALRTCVDKLEEQDNRLKLIGVEQERQKAHSVYLQDSIKQLENKMETPIAEGALTPSQLATKMGLFSLHGLPHAHLIEDICAINNIAVNSRVVRQETEYLQYRVETKGNVQIIQSYLKIPAQKIIVEWWKANKEKVKTIEYYKKNSKFHLKGEAKIPYYIVYKTKRYLA